MCRAVHVLYQVRLFETSWTVVHQAPLSMEFSRQEYWSRLLFPMPGNLPNPRVEPISFASPALASGFFSTVAPEKFNLLGKEKYCGTFKSVKLT